MPSDHTSEPQGAPLDLSTPPPRIGMVSLGCPKALVNSERILSRLRAEGYEISPSYEGSDAVIVNTCGFLDSAKAESLETIGEALAENGRVIVTGCLGKDADAIRSAHPSVLAVTGPQQYEQVVAAVRDAAPRPHQPFVDLTPPPADIALAREGAVECHEVRLTPRHYAYVKISEGCNHKCRFCIIPSLRGPLSSRPAADVLREAERLVAAGVRELLVISQDTSAYGVDIGHEASPWRRRDSGETVDVPAHIVDLAAALGSVGGEASRPWVRLHYVYPYPHVDRLIPLMAEGLILPYLDMPLQHASASVLRAMRRPANQEKSLTRIEAWRRDVPDLALRSTFIVGFPGETDADFEELLQWLRAAKLDRVGCFKYEDVAGAAANELTDHVPEAVKQERWERFMAAAQEISAEKLAGMVGRTLPVIVDEIDEDGASCRSMRDAPEIDGSVFIDEGFETLAVGDVINVDIDEASEYDLWGKLA
ncbi:MAG: 30S ribosomal protein S12 methylthiotransferase RimO [Rhodobacteraceae bacterium]|nr:30S ribosomal protein S12 methylthiotransferase RimO [Paracoccaceae bacterium]